MPGAELNRFQVISWNEEWWIHDRVKKRFRRATIRDLMDGAKIHVLTYKDAVTLSMGWELRPDKADTYTDWVDHPQQPNKRRP